MHPGHLLHKLLAGEESQKKTSVSGVESNAAFSYSFTGSISQRLSGALAILPYSAVTPTATITHDLSSARR